MTQHVTYHTLVVEGAPVFYREAGDPSLPKLVLFHGFPTSSSMFRELIPRLADAYHIIAPDYPLASPAILTGRPLPIPSITWPRSWKPSS